MKQNDTPESTQDIINALKEKDLMLKTELDETHKKTVWDLGKMSEENIDEIKGGEKEEMEIIEKGGMAFWKVSLLKVG